MASDSEHDLRLEIGHVLFLDLVGYSKLLIEEQKERLRQLTEIVLASAQVRESTNEQLVRLPTGDGMALVFRNSSEEPARCAREITQALKAHPEVQVRMGIHSGPVSEVSDVSGRTNIAGAGINMAQRVMDCGDAGHILLSQRTADDLAEYRQWAPYLHSLGECEVKHGVRLPLSSLYSDDFGRAETPARIQRAAKGRIVHKSLLAIVSLSVILLLAGAIWFYHRRSTQGVAPAKSIAVLPFENLSDEKANAYFAAGMQDEILTGLAKITALKVISRTSTQHYQSATANLRTVGEELGVANILEGSVQKAGEMVHINVQLIRAATDEHIWAESYDRNIQNVFAIEREIAETIATKLSALLSPHEAHELARLPTKNAQAYDLYLRAKYIAYQYWNGQVDSGQPALDLFQQAIKLDPNFAEAYVALGSVLIDMYRGGEQRSPAQLEQAQAYAEKALALLPDSTAPHLVLDAVWLVRGDQAQAARELEYLKKQTPKTAQVLRALAFSRGGEGDIEGKLQGLLRANELDPRNEVQLRWIGDTYDDLRRYAEAEQIYRQALAIAPDDWVLRSNADENLAACGRVSEGLSDLKSWPDQKLTATALTFKYSGISYLELLSHRYELALAAAQKVPLLGNRIAASGTLPIGDIKRNTDIGFCFLYLGDKVRAREAFLAARKGLEPQRATRGDDLDFLQSEADIASGLGEYEKALAAAQKAVALAPRATNFSDWADTQRDLANVYARFGKATEAVAILRMLLATAGTGDAVPTVDLQLHPLWDPIRKDPQFERLLRDFPAP